MRVNLKGIHKVRKKLASGRYATYYYAWRGGPRIEAPFGTPAFHQAYVAAHDEHKNRAKATDTLNGIFRAFEESSDYTRLAPRTRKDYGKHLALIEKEFGDLPIAALADSRTRGEFLAWRDRIAGKRGR